MIISRFSDEYFSFLLSGRVEDFAQASGTFNEALTAGVPMETLQERMNESHTSAELLCLLLDNDPVEKK
jgi:hypothetical protein